MRAPGLLNDAPTEEMTLARCRRVAVALVTSASLTPPDVLSQELAGLVRLLELV